MTAINTPIKTRERGIIHVKRIVLAVELNFDHLIKVTGTEVKRYNDSDMYLVFTEKETFKNVDSFWHWKFNSSDIQGKMKKYEGKKIKVRVYGWRIPFYSSYRNIIEVK